MFRVTGRSAQSVERARNAVGRYWLIQASSRFSPTPFLFLGSGQCGFNITPTIENAQDCHPVIPDMECDGSATFKAQNP